MRQHYIEPSAEG